MVRDTPVQVQGVRRTLSVSAGSPARAAGRGPRAPSWRTTRTPFRPLWTRRKGPAFDDDGNLDRTDSLQATVFRLPPGGGAPAVWLIDPRLASDPAVPFGVDGIRIDRNDRQLYVSVTAGNGTLDGGIYRLPRVDGPAAVDLEQRHRQPFVPGPIPVVPRPDDIASGKSGRLCVARAGTGQVSALGVQGSEEHHDRRHTVETRNTCGPIVPSGRPPTRARTPAARGDG